METKPEQYGFIFDSFGSYKTHRKVMFWCFFFLCLISKVPLSSLTCTFLLRSFQTHMNTHASRPHGRLQRRDGNRRRWEDKDITTAQQPTVRIPARRSALGLCCLDCACSVSFWLLEIPSQRSVLLMKKKEKKRKREVGAETSKNVNECQTSMFWPLSASWNNCKKRAAQTLIR